MAKDIKDPIISQYNAFVALNKILKNICGFYTILPNGYVYMKSLNDRFEKIMYIKGLSDISAYIGISVLPNKTFDFTKDAKKSTLSFNETDNAITLFDSNNKDLEPLVLNYAFEKETIERVYLSINGHPGTTTDHDWIGINRVCNNIIPEMYQHMDKFNALCLQSNRLSTDKFEKLPNDIVEELIACKPVVYTTVYGIRIDLTIQLFPTLKKDTTLYVHISDIKDMANPKKTYLIFLEEHPDFNIYTTCAIYQFHKE